MKRLALATITTVVGLSFARTARAQVYSLTDLGSLYHGSGSMSVGEAANDVQQATGYSETTSSVHAFLFSNGTMQDLGSFGGTSVGNGINGSGEVVGEAVNTNGFPHAFEYSGGQLQDLGTLGGSESIAYAINDAGLVVGSSHLTGDVQTHAFMYSNGQMQDIGTLGSANSVAYSVNASGQIVGGAGHAFLYSNGQMQDLGTLGGSNAIAYGINASGEVVGKSQVAGNTNWHAFLYSNNQMVDLGTLGGTTSSASGISASGQVVGYSYVKGYKAPYSHGFLYSNGKMQDLNSLVDATGGGYSIRFASGISPGGSIAAVAIGPQSPYYHGVLLTPHVAPTTVASVSSSGSQGDHDSKTPSTSADGRFVSFQSDSDNLVVGDTNTVGDVFVYDRLDATTERVSVDSSGSQGDAASSSGAQTISADGRFVAFASSADNLVANDTNGTLDVFVRDRSSQTTQRVSIDSSGNEANASSWAPSISSDGGFVAFCSDATNLVPGDTNGVTDVFVRDVRSGTTVRVSVDSNGAEADSDSSFSSISAGGRFVAFESNADNLVAGDTNLATDIFVHDLLLGTTVRVSVDSGGNQADGSSELPSITPDGRFVGFDSVADDLVGGDTNGIADSFLYDGQSGTTVRVSVDSTGAQANGASGSGATVISADGRFAAFQSDATNLVSGDWNGVEDVFLRDIQAGRTTRISVDSSGIQGDGISEAPSISSDGRFVAFDSEASNLVPDDTNGSSDVFTHGPFLTLEASPSSPVAGSTLTFETWTGEANGTNALVAIDLNGTPTFVFVMIAAFDGSGQWTFSATVPPGLSGTAVTFETIGFVPTGRIETSNPATVSFQ